MREAEKRGVKYMEERFGISKKIFSGYVFSSSGEKVWIFSKEIEKKDLQGLRIEGKGLLFGRFFKKQDKFKPTTNILQIFGKHATKNIVYVDEKEKDKYIKGFDLEKELDIEEGYVILKHEKDILGCGLYREGRIKNQIPKTRIIPQTNILTKYKLE